MECNPDDINIKNIKGWKNNNINRISLGVQSFFDSDLELMNRSHNSSTATQAIELIKDNFKNFSSTASKIPNRMDATLRTV